MNSVLHKTKVQLNEELSLIVQAQTNPSYFEPLYNQYFERIFRFVYQRVETRDEAADITSQVFMKALVNIKKFKYRKVPFSAWLYRIAISEIGNYYHQSAKNRMVNVETDSLNQLVENEELELKNERIENLLSLLKELSGNDLLLIEMRFFEDRPFREIGDILGITENNAKVRVYRVLDKLKEKIK
jgi:RNA polymerase sigma-70 factor, ECF subfamily